MDKPARKQGGRQNNRRNGDNGPPVVGLGDHMPAFMTIPLPKLKSTRSKAAKTEKDSDGAEAAA